MHAVTRVMTAHLSGQFPLLHSLLLSPGPSPQLPRCTLLLSTSKPLTSGRPFPLPGWHGVIFQPSFPADVPLKITHSHPPKQSWGLLGGGEWQSSISSSACDCWGLCSVINHRVAHFYFAHLTVYEVHLTIKREKKISPEEKRRNLCKNQRLLYTTVLNIIISPEKWMSLTLALLLTKVCCDTWKPASPPGQPACGSLWVKACLSFFVMLTISDIRTNVQIALARPVWMLYRSWDESGHLLKCRARKGQQKGDTWLFKRWHPSCCVIILIRVNISFRSLPVNRLLDYFPSTINFSPAR